MAISDEYKGWRYFGRAVYDGDRLTKYTVAFYRKAGAEGWYDEIRYDSHDRRGGRLMLAPHLHLKISSALKQDVDAAIAEIKRIVDNGLAGIEQLAHASHQPGGEADAGDESEL